MNPVITAYNAALECAGKPRLAPEATLPAEVAAACEAAGLPALAAAEAREAKLREALRVANRGLVVARLSMQTHAEGCWQAPCDCGLADLAAVAPAIEAALALPQDRSALDAACAAAVAAEREALRGRLDCGAGPDERDNDGGEARCRLRRRSGYRGDDCAACELANCRRSRALVRQERDTLRAALAEERETALARAGVDLRRCPHCGVTAPHSSARSEMTCGDCRVKRAKAAAAQACVDAARKAADGETGVSAGQPMARKEVARTAYLVAQGVADAVARVARELGAKEPT